MYASLLRYSFFPTPKFLQYAICSKLFKTSHFVFSFSEFYAKQTEKADTLEKLLKNDVIDLETLLCPKAGKRKLYRDIQNCELHSVSCAKRKRSRHCATKKAKLFNQWLTNELPFGKINSISPSSEFVSNFHTLQLHNGWRPAYCYIC